MKEYILKIAKDLEQGTITEDKARSLLLGLFGVKGTSQPLTVSQVNKMMRECSKDTWKAVQGNDDGWKEWWSDRSKLNLNDVGAKSLL